MQVKGGVNHIMLRVKDLSRAEAFYSDLLGLDRVGQRKGIHFYSSGQYNHELALVEDNLLDSAQVRNNGLVHIAFNVENSMQLTSLYEKLKHLNYPVSPGVDHVIARSFYTRDPDGYSIELTTDRAASEWTKNPQAFKADYPLDL